MNFSKNRVLQFLGLTTLVWTCPASAQDQKILGFLNPATGAFEPYVAAASSGVKPATLGVNKGTISVAMTFANNSGITSASILQCTVQTTIIDTTTGLYDTRSYSTQATVTPANVTCTVNVPYSVVVEPATTRLSISASVSRVAQTSPIAGHYNINNIYINETVQSMPLPQSGGTTNLNFQNII
ncbi:hypothetical protein [Methylocystis heyeri]|uniref:DUF11 domain-containing protein n=1 Tax=Methylocystis heyeri TaxID=391905 RepID=A0A6B8KEY8_9HYPH|nr:hypothetical protein [Methylocystis heyeri]QGM45138.1 hypothetical protein H2LOC_005215 [Methylocystis heyeri]